MWDLGTIGGCSLSRRLVQNKKKVGLYLDSSSMSGQKRSALLSLDGNKSPSFNFCEGLRGLVGHASASSSDHVM